MYTEKEHVPAARKEGAVAVKEIFLLETDSAAAEKHIACLRQAGYGTSLHVGGAEQGLDALKAHTPDLVLLDAGLCPPGGANYLLRAEEAAGAPVLVFSESFLPGEAARLLDAGAEDCLSGSLAADEFLARVRRSLRRGHTPRSEALLCQDLVLYPAARRVTAGGEAVELTVREFDLLEFFLRHPGIALTRNQLLNGVWGYDFYGDAKVVDVYVRYLRQKLDHRFGRPYIATVRGVGYRLTK